MGTSQPHDDICYRGRRSEAVPCGLLHLTWHAAKPQVLSPLRDVLLKSPSQTRSHQGPCTFVLRAWAVAAGLELLLLVHKANT